MYAPAFLYRSSDRRPGHRSCALPTPCGACPAVSDRVAVGRCDNFLSSRCAIHCGARIDHLRGRHHGAFHLRRHVAEFGPANSRDGERLAAPRDVDRPSPPSRGSACRDCVHAFAMEWRSGWERNGRSKRSWDGALWAVFNRRGVGIVLVDGRVGRSVPPGATKLRKTGGGLWCRFR